MYGLFQALQSMYEEHGDMEGYIRSYAKKYDEMEEIDALTAIDAICQYFQKHEITGIVPKNTNSCCKRVCMFLRWMVRSKDKGVDFGLWKSVKPSELYLPLDVHCARRGRALGLLTRKQNDRKAVEEITERLKEFCPDDPAKYDFALFAPEVEKALAER